VLILDKFKAGFFASFFRMKFILVALILCTTVYVVCGEKLLASSSRQLNRRETKLVKRLVKRQVLSGKKKEKKDVFGFFLLFFVND